MSELVLYTRDGCGLCAEARATLEALLEERRRAGLPSPTLVERDIATNAGLGAGVLHDDPGGRARRPTPRARDQPGQAAPPARQPRRDARHRRPVTSPLGRRRRRHRPHVPRRDRRGPAQLPLALRAAARARVPRPDHGGRGRIGRRSRSFVAPRAGSPSGTRSPMSRASARSSSILGVTATYAAARSSTTCPRCASSAASC